MGFNWRAATVFVSLVSCRKGKGPRFVEMEAELSDEEEGGEEHRHAWPDGGGGAC